MAWLGVAMGVAGEHERSPAEVQPGKKSKGPDGQPQVQAAGAGEQGAADMEDEETPEAAAKPVPEDSAESPGPENEEHQKDSEEGDEYLKSLDAAAKRNVAERIAAAATDTEGSGRP